MELERYGPWALILGASEGVGPCFARELAAAGIHLVLVARRTAPLEELARELRAEHGVEVRTLGADLTLPDALERVRAVTDPLEVGLMIFLAGASHLVAGFYDRPVEEYLRIVACNVVAQTSFCHHFGGRMRERKRGGIVLVGSTTANAGTALVAAYAASKAFVQTLAEGLWYELRPHGVHVLGLILGLTRTPAMARLGLRMDHPDFPPADPEAVAREGLEFLADGPIRVTGGNAAFVQRLRELPRAEAVEIVSRGSRELG